MQVYVKHMISQERERTLETTNNVAPCLASCNSHNVGEPNSVAFPSLSALRDQESAEMLHNCGWRMGVSSKSIHLWTHCQQLIELIYCAVLWPEGLMLLSSLIILAVNLSLHCFFVFCLWTCGDKSILVWRRV